MPTVAATRRRVSRRSSCSWSRTSPRRAPSSTPRTPPSPAPWSRRAPPRSIGSTPAASEPSSSASVTSTWARSARTGYRATRRTSARLSGEITAAAGTGLSPNSSRCSSGGCCGGKRKDDSARQPGQSAAGMGWESRRPLAAAVDSRSSSEAVASVPRVVRYLSAEQKLSIRRPATDEWKRLPTAAGRRFPGRLALTRDRQQVFALDPAAAVGRLVQLLVQRHELRPALLPRALGLEALFRLDRGPVALLEVALILLEAREGERRGSALELELETVAREQLAHVVLVAPEWRRGRERRWRRHVLAEDAEHAPDQALRRPVHCTDRAAAAAHAHQLVCRDLVARGELDAEHRQNAIERGVRERQRLAVALDEGDLEPRVQRSRARHVEQLGREVEADDARPAPRRAQRDVAGAGGDVEHVVLARDADGREQVHGRHLLDQGGNLRVVAGRPGRAVLRLELGDGIGLVGDTHWFLLARVGGSLPAARRRCFASTGHSPRMAAIGQQAQISPSRAARAAAAAREGTRSFVRMFAT